MTIAIEVGKFYRTRNGYKCGPMGPALGAPGALTGYIRGTGMRVFNLATGEHSYGNADLDLVAEWTDDVAADAPLTGEGMDDQSRRTLEEQERVRTIATAATGGDNLLHPNTSTTIPAEPDSLEYVQQELDAEIAAESAYRTVRTNVPPVLAIEDGELVIKLIDGPLTLVAGVGDGKWFFGQVVAKLVDPALVAQQTLHDFGRAYLKSLGK